MDPRTKDEMKKEAFVMKELSHPCIVRLYGISHSRKLNSTLMVFINCSRISIYSEWLISMLNVYIYFFFVQDFTNFIHCFWLLVQAN